MSAVDAILKMSSFDLGMLQEMPVAAAPSQERIITLTQRPVQPPLHGEVFQCRGCAAYPLFEAAGQRHAGEGVSNRKFEQATITCERLIRVGSCQVQANRDSRS